MPHSPGSAFGKNAPGLHNCDLHQQKNLAPTEVAKGFGGGQGTRKQAVETGKGSVGPNEVRTASGGGVPVDCTPPPNGTRSRMMQLVRDPTKIVELFDRSFRFDGTQHTAVISAIFRFGDPELTIFPSRIDPAPGCAGLRFQRKRPSPHTPTLNRERFPAHLTRISSRLPSSLESSQPATACSHSVCPCTFHKLVQHAALTVSYANAGDHHVLSAYLLVALLNFCPCRPFTLDMGRFRGMLFRDLQCADTTTRARIAKAAFDATFNYQRSRPAKNPKSDSHSYTPIRLRSNAGHHQNIIQFEGNTCTPQLLPKFDELRMQSGNRDSCRESRIESGKKVRAAQKPGTTKTSFNLKDITALRSFCQVRRAPDAIRKPRQLSRIESGKKVRATQKPGTTKTSFNVKDIRALRSFWQVRRAPDAIREPRQQSRIESG
ncbi:hypothetical protein AXG93_242s1100 [Marchantia polymorpha subsp. ruderalis]|uniref:Uncharacterized protein n=1 Tax=Marchantia polymorpha subsp. ruderalis TaxID=1480154 RepID=A0A176VLT0_MARPO|nr:hypothetical protein AXG93_242s1100 [Marchantia polymorpha subsp. ruderalis]